MVEGVETHRQPAGSIKELAGWYSLDCQRDLLFPNGTLKIPR